MTVPIIEPVPGPHNQRQTPGDALDFSWAPALVEHAITKGRLIRVVCIGAGFSGVNLAIHLREKCHDYEFVAYEMAKDVGGVWHHNRYMGAACDLPAHTYQYSFAENTQWSRFYAPQPEIRQYISDVVDKYKIRDEIKLEHQVIGAEWDDDEGKWHVKAKNLKTGEEFEDVADFVCYATGLLSKPQWPQLPGREKFKGIIHHSSGWDYRKEEEDNFGVSPYKGKRVGVIGTGSSAIQIVPVMREKVGAEGVVYNFGRTKTWLTGTFASEILEQLVKTKEGELNHTFSDETKKKLREDRAYYRHFRGLIEADLSSVHAITHTGAPIQEEYREAVRKAMLELLSSKPEIAEALVPDFPLACKRMTPGPGYLESLVLDNCHLVTDAIDSFTEKGLKLKSGEEIELDAIICATGFNTTSVPAFPIYGKNGVNLQDLWKDEARTYLGLLVPEMPNFFSVLGAQAVVGTGSLLSMMEQAVAYVAKTVNKCQREGYKSWTIKDSVVDDFLKYTDNYFPRTVYSANCRSWYKNGEYGGRIRTVWPGASSHCFIALRDPRWEDFEWVRHDKTYPHSMSWLGNGNAPDHLPLNFFTDELRAQYKETTFIA